MISGTILSLACIAAAVYPITSVPLKGIPNLPNTTNFNISSAVEVSDEGGCETSVCTLPTTHKAIYFLELGSKLLSPSGQYSLEIQENGNVVLFCGHRGLWDTGTYGIPIFKGLALQGDGNIVLYRSDNKPIWATGTNGRSGNTLVLQDDGNLVVYSGGGSALWSTNTDGQC